MNQIRLYIMYTTWIITKVTPLEGGGESETELERHYNSEEALKRFMVLSGIHCNPVGSFGTRVL